MERGDGRYQNPPNQPTVHAYHKCSTLYENGVPVEGCWRLAVVIVTADYTQLVVCVRVQFQLYCAAKTKSAQNCAFH